jgi:hypothetical protein
MTGRDRPAPIFALTLSEVVREMAPKMTLDEYTSFLHEARGYIRDRKIHKLRPGALDRDAIREIAQDLKLPARLSGAAKALAVTSTLIGMLGAMTTMGTGGAVVGGLVSIASVVWTGKVGHVPARMSWLQWAFNWEVEKQASDV